MILLLIGCHLFASAAIDCTRDELPECGPGTDSPVDDSAEDSDSAPDSEPPPPTPEVGVVFSASGADWSHVRVLEPTDVVAWTWSGPGLQGGPVASDGDKALLALGASTAWLEAEASEAGPELPAKAVDVAWSEGFWAATANGLGNDAGETWVSPATIKGIAPDGEGGLYVLTNTRNVISAWSFDGESIERLQADFDPQNARSVDIFTGPGGEPHTCSAAGGVYPLDRLAAGDTSPERVATGGLTDVVGCGYDPGTDEVILFSPAKEVLRVAAGGAARVVATAPEGSTLVAGSAVLP